LRPFIWQSGLPPGEVIGFIQATTLIANTLIGQRGAMIATTTTERVRNILEIAYERRYRAKPLQLPGQLPSARLMHIPGRADYWQKNGGTFRFGRSSSHKWPENKPIQTGDGTCDKIAGLRAPPRSLRAKMSKGSLPQPLRINCAV